MSMIPERYRTVYDFLAQARPHLDSKDLEKMRIIQELGSAEFNLADAKQRIAEMEKRCEVCDSLDVISEGPTKFVCRHCWDMQEIERLENLLSNQHRKGTN